MTPQEFKNLTHSLVPRLKEHFAKDGLTVRVLQDTLSFNNQLLIGVSLFKGADTYEVYRVSNDGNVTSWQYQGNTKVN